MTSAAETLSGPAESARTSASSELDRAVNRVGDAASRFAALTLAQRVDLLRRVARGVAEEAETWVRRGHEAKGLPEDAGEEWLVGPVPVLRNLRLLGETLSRLEQGRTTLPPQAVRTRGDGRVEARVFPTDPFDAALFAGIEVRQVMAAGQTERSVLERAGGLYHGGPTEKGVSVILGAGNVSSIPPMDALTKCFAEGFCAVLKMNPVNEWVGPHLERAFAPMIDAGYLAIVYGGAEAGAYLTQHPGISDVHITGSSHTHDRIVWGPPGPEQDRRKAAGDPVLKKSISSELGNVSPVMVVPDAYSEAELDYLAHNVAAMVSNNASFNCNAAKMLVLSAPWAQREVFLRRLSRVLVRIPTRRAYYPGATERFARLTEGRERVERIGDDQEGRLPWTLVHDLDPKRPDDPAFSTEPFCAILSVVALDEADPAAFLDAATRFANDTLWGTLNAMLVVPPRLERSAEVGAAVDRAVETLRYGTVAVNQWPALVYALTSPSWGGHPSSTLADIQSGLGWVHNTYLLDGIEKAVLRAPLRLRPKPVWFAEHRRAAAVGRGLVSMEARPAWWKLPGLAVEALRG